MLTLSRAAPFFTRQIRHIIAAVIELRLLRAAALLILRFSPDEIPTPYTAAYTTFMTRLFFAADARYAKRLMLMLRHAKIFTRYVMPSFFAADILPKMLRGRCRLRCLLIHAASYTPHMPSRHYHAIFYYVASF